MTDGYRDSKIQPESFAHIELKEQLSRSVLTDICATGVNERFQELALGADHNAIGLVAEVAVPGRQARDRLGGQPAMPVRMPSGQASALG